MLQRIFTSLAPWIIGLTLLLGGFTHASAGDSTSFNPVPVPVVAKSAGGGVPVGTVIAWPVSRNPEDMDKWLECNGQSVSSAVYPELFAVVGGSVPNYQGYFLRGVGGNSAGLGQAQGDAIRNITGHITTDDATNTTSGGAFSVIGSYAAGAVNGYHAAAIVGFDASRIVPTAEENRPVNRAVRYLIRAKP